MHKDRIRPIFKSVLNRPELIKLGLGLEFGQTSSVRSDLCAENVRPNQALKFSLRVSCRASGFSGLPFFSFFYLFLLLLINLYSYFT